MRHLRPDTDEGGEPPGSRKGRPRYPPEGRGKRAYESVERKHNETQNSNFMCTDIDRIAELAREDPQRQFFSIAHLITVEKMCEAFRRLRKDASAGIDGVTYEQYAANAEENIRQLHQRLKDGKYQVQPLRRVYIPKRMGSRGQSRFRPSRISSCRRWWWNC
jgi:retron-type reverse transcriptase